MRHDISILGVWSQKRCTHWLHQYNVFRLTTQCSIHSQLYIGRWLGQTGTQTLVTSNLSCLPWPYLHVRDWVSSFIFIAKKKTWKKNLKDEIRYTNVKLDLTQPNNYCKVHSSKHQSPFAGFRVKKIFENFQKWKRLN